MSADGWARRSADVRVRALDCPTPNKYGYETRDQAKKKLRQEKQRVEKFRAKRLGIYLCKCGLFHLGNRSTEIHRDGSSENVALACAVKFDGNPCAWPGEHRVSISGRDVWLCAHHKIELDARAAERKKAAA